jgi:hypothetical protein
MISTYRRSSARLAWLFCFAGRRLYVCLPVRGSLVRRVLRSYAWATPGAVTCIMQIDFVLAGAVSRCSKHSRTSSIRDAREPECFFPHMPCGKRDAPCDAAGGRGREAESCAYGALCIPVWLMVTAAKSSFALFVHMRRFAGTVLPPCVLYTPVRYCSELSTVDTPADNRVKDRKMW